MSYRIRPEGDRTSYRASWRRQFTDREHYFVSVSTAYYPRKAHDLITRPAFIVIKAGSLEQDNGLHYRYRSC